MSVKLIGLYCGTCMGFVSYYPEKEPTTCTCATLGIGPLYINKPRTVYVPTDGYEKEEGKPMTKEEYLEFHQKCCQRMVETTKAKNSDYTGGSQDPFANFQQIGHLVQLPHVVAIGFLTRMSDKFSRIGSFITKGSLLVKDESVEDTLIDLANYCILMAGYLRSQKRLQPQDGGLGHGTIRRHETPE